MVKAEPVGSNGTERPVRRLLLRFWYLTPLGSRFWHTYFAKPVLGKGFQRYRGDTLSDKPYESKIELPLNFQRAPKLPRRQNYFRQKSTG